MLLSPKLSSRVKTSSSSSRTTVELIFPYKHILLKNHSKVKSYLLSVLSDLMPLVRPAMSLFNTMARCLTLRARVTVLFPLESTPRTASLILTVYTPSPHPDMVTTSRLVLSQHPHILYQSAYLLSNPLTLLY